MAFRNSASRRLSVYSSELLWLPPVSSKQPIHFNRGRGRLVLNLPWARVTSASLQASRRARPFAPSASSFQRCTSRRSCSRSKASAAPRASFSVTLGALPLRARCFARSRRRSQVLECRQVAARGREVGLAKTAERSARLQRQMAVFGVATFGFADGSDAAKCVRPPGAARASARTSDQGWSHSDRAAAYNRISRCRAGSAGVVPSENAGLTPRHVDSADGD